ncbi:hypothetical protein BN2475_490060 [Paraburkholderia ribeironis]|uniref:Uncharacterized protein n=1 Tax=Paraburkholderia ribeironis TaxID=1247936 RepID=A0A1N7SBW6_9BURK|nr:hypothetical protein BN2475_490060 [Paraburkholderia ribeironis]
MCTQSAVHGRNLPHEPPALSSTGTTERSGLDGGLNLPFPLKALAFGLIWRTLPPTHPETGYTAVNSLRKTRRLHANRM